MLFFYFVTDTTRDVYHYTYYYASVRFLNLGFYERGAILLLCPGRRVILLLIFFFSVYVLHFRSGNPGLAREQLTIICLWPLDIKFNS
jgi:hypothetical protein